MMGGIPVFISQRAEKSNYSPWGGPISEASPSGKTLKGQNNPLAYYGEGKFHDGRHQLSPMVGTGLPPSMKWTLPIIMGTGVFMMGGTLFSPGEEVGSKG